MCPGREISQRHQVLPVAADEYSVVIERVLVSGDAPIQGAAGYRRVDTYAIINSRFDFCGFLVIVPGDKLKPRKLLGSRPHAVCFCKTAEPSLPALLLHDAIGAPGSERVVETFVGGSHRKLGWILLRGRVEVVQIVQRHRIALRRIGRLYPGEPTIRVRARKSAIILKDELKIACGVLANA